MSGRLRIVLASSRAHYPEGGGHLSHFLQYVFGANALGHDVFVLDPLATGKEDVDPKAAIFLKRLWHYGFRDRCAVLQHTRPGAGMNLESSSVQGVSMERLKEVIEGADVVWNFCCALRQPLLSMFKHRVLVDLDPGIVQIPAQNKIDLNVLDHHAFLTVGTKLHDPDCQVPTLGVTWNRFLPPAFLPMWTMADDPGTDAPFSTVTQWTWKNMVVNDRVVPKNKRTAYLSYVALPQRARQPFELAANIPAADKAGDRELLRRHGWRIVDPHRVARSPAAYRRYVRRSRAEILCPKPAYRDLKTGWFSDRSSCYLATGRPVLAEDTGFSDHLPTGDGLLAFRNIEEAVEGAAAIARDYQRHSRAARALAEEYFDARRTVATMLRATGF